MIGRFVHVATVLVALVVGAAGFETLESVFISPEFGIAVTTPEPTARTVTREYAVVARGATMVEARETLVTLRAWSPAPRISVLREGDSHVTIRLLNIPARVRLRTVSDVIETTRGQQRMISIGGGGRRDLHYIAPADGVRIAALGDTDASETFAQALNTAHALSSDFFLVLGDLFYRDEAVPRMQAILERAPLPVDVVRGNHDYASRLRREALPMLGPSFYAFSYGGVGFVLLDSGRDQIPGMAVESDQHKWLQRTLALPIGNPIVVATHKSPIGHHEEKRFHRMLDAGYATQLARDFEDAGVRFVLVGHRHTHDLESRNGVTYVTAGEGKHGPEHNPVLALITVRSDEPRIEFVPIWNDRLEAAAHP